MKLNAQQLVPPRTGKEFGSPWGKGPECDAQVGTKTRNGTLTGAFLGVLLFASLALFAMPVALAGGPGDFGAPSDSEGQGSLPSFASGSGLAFVGDLQDLVAVLGTSVGSGEVEFFALDDTVSAAFVSGDLRVSLDLSEMLERGVQAHLVLGDALETGFAEVGYGAWNSGVFALPEFSLEVPLSTLYGPQMPKVSDLRIRALGHGGDLYDLRIGLHGGVLTLTQAFR